MAGSRWLVDEAWPSSLPPLLEQGLGFSVCAVAVLPFCRRGRGGGWWRLAGAGLLVFGVPALLACFAPGIAIKSGAALFAVAPLLIVVTARALEADQGSASQMMPALVGLAGGLLLLPFELPGTARDAWMFLLVFVSVVLASLGSVWMHRALWDGGNVPAGVAVVCGMNALLLLPAGLVHGRFVSHGFGQDVLRAVVLDMPSLLLLLWLMRAMPPERLAVRFFLVPLAAVVEGLLLLWPRIDLRAGVGMLLLALGAWLMLQPLPVFDEAGLQLGRSK